MADTNGNGPKWVAFYRAAVIGLIAVAGYFLQDVHATVKESAQDLESLKVKAAGIEAAVQNIDRRVDRLEGWRDAFPVRR